MRFLVSCIIAVLLAVLSMHYAHADPVARGGNGDTVRLTEKPCPPIVLKHIPQGSRGYFRLAVTKVGGKDYVACWTLRPDGVVLVAYEDGDAGLIPAVQFRDEPGV